MKAFLAILALFVLYAQADEGCWLRSYGRGVGKPISVCKDGLDQNGLLCYPKCQDGFSGAGPVCWQKCQDGFRDDGMFCFKPQPYGRGAGYPIWSEGRCNGDNSQGCEKHLAMWYPKCKPGFHAVGCCVCSPNCMEGQTDIGISCGKKAYGRGVGEPLTCAKGLELSGAICYPPCSNGYKGIGPVCWGSCPAGYNACGALCLKDQSCAGKLFEYGKTGLKIVEDVAAKSAGGPGGMLIGAIPGTIELVKELIYPICP